MAAGSFFLKSHLLCTKQIKETGYKNLFSIKIKKDAQPKFSFLKI
jgi:hypothetical protein